MRGEERGGSKREVEWWLEGSGDCVVVGWGGKKDGGSLVGRVEWAECRGIYMQVA